MTLPDVPSQRLVTLVSRRAGFQRFNPGYDVGVWLKAGALAEVDFLDDDIALAIVRKGRENLFHRLKITVHS
jgi:hypothetical protein